MCDTLLGSSRYSGAYDSSYTIISLSQPKRLFKTPTFEKKKKALHPVEKFFWPTNSLIIENEKPKSTTFKSSKGNLTKNVQVEKSFL